MRIEVISKRNEKFTINIKHKISLFTDDGATKKTYLSKLLTDNNLTKNINIIGHPFDYKPTFIIINRNIFKSMCITMIRTILSETEISLRELLEITHLTSKEEIELTNNKIILEIINESKLGNNLTILNKLKLCKYIIENSKQYWNRNSLTNENIYIIDDDEIIKSIELARFINNDINNYFILINRDKLPTLSYDIDSIYEMKKLGPKEYTNTNKVDVKYTTDFKSDFIGIEDSGSGKTFFKELIKKDINSFSSKNKVVKYLKEINLKNCKILCIVDICAFGSEILELLDYCSKNNLDLYFLKYYKSFEYLLLKSNMFNNNITTNLEETEILNFANPENYYEYLIYKLTKDKDYSYSKNADLKDCYYKKCICKHTQNCDKFTKQDDKIKYMFKETIFEYLIDINLQNNNLDNIGHISLTSIFNNENDL